MRQILVIGQGAQDHLLNSEVRLTGTQQGALRYAKIYLERAGLAVCERKNPSCFDDEERLEQQPGVQAMVTAQSCAPHQETSRLRADASYQADVDLCTETYDFLRSADGDLPALEILTGALTAVDVLRRAALHEDQQAGSQMDHSANNHRKN
ncbi:MAG: hypothetical protein AAF355_15905 [Myxococcota bacterium]